MAPSTDTLLHEILEAQAAGAPDNVALECHPNARWTYRGLNEISDRLARWLKGRRADRQGVVALNMAKSDVCIISILGILKAGKAWLPLPLDAPQARIGQIVCSCDIELILCSESSQRSVTNLAPCTNLDEMLESPELHTCSVKNLKERTRDTKDLCHILFTSGSTGVPKGVMIEHRAVVHNVWALVERFGLHGRTRTLQFAAPTFDIFGLDLFMTFVCGGCLVMAPQSTIMEDITTFVQNAGITYAQLKPTVIQFIDPEGVPDLEILVSSGEALPQHLASVWRSRVSLVNAYGPTETIICTVQELSGNDVDAACNVKAVAGLDVCVLAEESGEPVAERKIGEICVAGPQLLRGYCSIQHDLESPKWVRNGRRYYRTGDVGRVEGCSAAPKTFRYLGRRDGQVKVHGVRLELGDVEQSILSYPLVKQCAALLPVHGCSAGRLCAVVAPHSSAQLTLSSSDKSAHAESDFAAESTLQPLPVQVLCATSDIINALQEAKHAAAEQLPTHAIPSTWWAVKRLPLTSSGKIDRMKLRVWLEDMDPEAYLCLLNSFTGIPDEPVDLANDKETRLLQSLWAEVLNRPTISIGTACSFVELGADSLDVTRLVSRARKAGLSINFSKVYATKSIQELVLRKLLKACHLMTPKARATCLLACFRALGHSRHSWTMQRRYVRSG
ncbi:MAG: hypothetical protein Q9181_006292 [Wetmoreana brouardii]